MITFGDIGKKVKTEYKKMPFWLLRDEPETLRKHKKILMDQIYYRTGSKKYHEIFNFSFEYLIKYPESYDGSSGDQEFNIIQEGQNEYRYDITSIPHDVASGLDYDRDIKRMKKANKLFDVMNKDMHISFLNTFKRRLVDLWIVNKFRLWQRKRQGKVYKVTSATVEFERMINVLV